MPPSPAWYAQAQLLDLFLPDVAWRSYLGPARADSFDAFATPQLSAVKELVYARLREGILPVDPVRNAIVVSYDLASMLRLDVAYYLWGGLLQPLRDLQSSYAKGLYPLMSGFPAGAATDGSGRPPPPGLYRVSYPGTAKCAVVRQVPFTTPALRHGNPSGRAWPSGATFFRSGTRGR